MTTKARVKAGMAYLDSVYGKAWRGKINKKTLDLENRTTCILGQTDSDYESHRKRLGLTPENIYNFGFHINPPSDLIWRGKETWQQLTKAWKDAL